MGADNPQSDGWEVFGSMFYLDVKTQFDHRQYLYRKSRAKQYGKMHTITNRIGGHVCVCQDAEHRVKCNKTAQKPVQQLKNTMYCIQLDIT